MKIVLFCRSLIDAHFLRGIASELVDRGHRVESFESHAAGIDRALADVELILVHESTDPNLVRRLGDHRSRARDVRIFFRAEHAVRRADLTHYDAVLANGEVVRATYAGSRTRIWHDAADTRLFHPIPNRPREGDLVWIGNWDEKRAAQLNEFVIEPVRAMSLTARFHGAGYPSDAIASLRQSGIDHAGPLANDRVPEVLARFGVTVHLPRPAQSPPSMRLFEALACGIPLISPPWEDADNLFTPGRDFLLARNGEEMRRHLWAVLADKHLAAELVDHGLKTVRARHTCTHRVDELLQIYDEIKPRHPSQTKLFNPKSP